MGEYKMRKISTKRVHHHMFCDKNVLFMHTHTHTHTNNITKLKHMFNQNHSTSGESCDAKYKFYFCIVSTSKQKYKFLSAFTIVVSFYSYAHQNCATYSSPLVKLESDSLFALCNPLTAAQTHSH